MRGAQIGVDHIDVGTHFEGLVELSMFIASKSPIASILNLSRTRRAESHFGEVVARGGARPSLYPNLRTIAAFAPAPVAKSTHSHSARLQW